jgi:hypothetical protein
MRGEGFLVRGRISRASLLRRELPRTTRCYLYADIRHDKKNSYYIDI